MRTRAGPIRSHLARPHEQQDVHAVGALPTGRCVLSPTERARPGAYVPVVAERVGRTIIGEQKMRTGRRYRIEASLLAERDRAANDLHQIEEDEAEPQPVSSGTLARTHGTDAEAASDAQEEAGDFIMATRLSARLAKIDDALRLLAENPGEFERCGHCGAEIEGARLELVPWSRLCSTCARLNGRLI